MIQENKNILYYGSVEALQPKTALKAGKLDLLYENGFIRYVKLGNQEVIRMINHAVRDYNWGTVPLRIFDEKIVQSVNTFNIHYQAEAKQGDVHFLWKCSIVGSADSTIVFTIEGEALTSFKRNRVGFTVLHPIQECEGKEVHIIDPNGGIKVGKFPKLISPTQTFFDVQGMEWNLGNNKAILDFSGDVFETEDQRNWIDASFKTYCTPLGLPFPVLLKKGDSVKQTIKLSVSSTSDEAISKSANFTFSISKESFKLPKINIAQSSEVEKLSLSEIDKIKAIQFDNYQVDIKLFNSDWKENLKRAFQESDALSFPLELSLFFDDIEKELDEFIQIVKMEKPTIAILNIFNRNPYVAQKKTVDLTLPILRRFFPRASIGSGTNAFFAELNRDRIVLAELDHIVYSFNPQVHAYDNTSLVETIEAQSYTVLTAFGFSKGKMIHVSPITFKMRWNPNATGVNIVNKEQLPPEVDVRQMSLFGASWVLGTINSLLTSEPASLTFFETVGMKGIMQSSKPLLAKQFFAPAGTVYPMYFIFKLIMEHKLWDLYPIQSNQTLIFTGLALGKKGEGISRMLLANYTANPITINISSDFINVEFVTINYRNIQLLMEDPDRFDNIQREQGGNIIKIPAFGIVWLINE